MTDLASVPYSETHWCRDRQQQDIGDTLLCPDCDSGHQFEVFSYAKSDGSARLYRGCKMCGFWQDVDDPPHRCRKSPYWAASGGWEYDLMWFSMSLAIVVTGGGSIALWRGW